MNLTMKTLTTLGAALVVGMSPAAFAAQQSGGGLVTVNISNVANDLAKNLNVEVSQIPVSVQVPVGVAANVCGVAANVLGQQKGAGGAACDAKSTSTALDQVVQRQMSSKKQK